MNFDYFYGDQSETFTFYRTPKVYARIDEAAKFISMGINSFREIVKEAKAILHIRKIALVDMDRIDKYLELFYDEE